MFCLDVLVGRKWTETREGSVTSMLSWWDLVCHVGTRRDGENFRQVTMVMSYLGHGLRYYITVSFKLSVLI